MPDCESIKKMLRAVLQSSKEGVSIHRLQEEYRSLCFENIPLKKLGFSNLEDYLRSIPSVVRLDYNNGDLRCFAAICSETAHIAQLVARQKSSMKSGCSQVINCRMRRKASNPYMRRGCPMSSLRQPSAGGTFKPTSRFLPHGGYRGFSASGDMRQRGQCFIPPVEYRHSAPQPSVIPDSPKNVVILQEPKENPSEQVSRTNCFESRLYDYDEIVVQRRLNLLLKKYPFGLWMSKLPTVFSELFSQQLHPRVLKDLEKWTHICVVEKSYSTKGDSLVYPPLPSLTAPRNGLLDGPAKCSNNLSTISTFTSSQKSPSVPFPVNPVPKPTVFSIKPPSDSALGLATQASDDATSLFAPQKMFHRFAVTSSNPNVVTAHNLRPNGQPLDPTEKFPSKKNSSCNISLEDLPSQKSPLFSISVSCSRPVKSCAALLPDDVCYRIKELLSKYSNGLWVHALPKLFMDTYKTPFPERFMNRFSLLPDLCTVEYPIPNNSNKAILYKSMTVNLEETDSRGSQKTRTYHLPSGIDVIGPGIPANLVHPSLQYPSVLVIDAKTSNAVTIRYVGKDYSEALEAMENAMVSFYKKNSTIQPLPKLVVRQLVAAKGENDNELTRAQVTEVTDNNITVYLLDHGFSLETHRESLLDLHNDFLSLPFQATNIRLAGLEAFSSHPSVLSTLEKFAVGKILLMEILCSPHPNDLPEALLYDTSQDEDININSVCLKELQDKTMNNPLTVNSTYQGVCVTNVCGDGIVFCQLPCRGTARLNMLLEKIKAFFISQITSEYLVSKPFHGKMCLTCYKDKWSRAEITNLYDNRIIEVVLIDLGVPATVEVTELREIPIIFIQDFTLIPPQAIRCRLVDVIVPEGDWSPDVLSWLKDALLGVENCKMKILKLEEDKGGRLLHINLHVDADCEDMYQSINHQLSNPDRWQTLNSKKSLMATDDCSASVMRLALNTPTHLHPGLCESSSADRTARMPPPHELPPPGQNMDVYIQSACHPGYFVLQPWQGLHKLVLLMGEMVLYYNQTVTSTVMEIKKGDIYAAKIDKNWYRAVVKGVLSNDLISIYELDHGKYEVLRRTFLQPLIEEFRQLPFQAITAQLAGVPKCHWSEEASIVFRNHVEKQALVAQIESVQDESERAKGELWERKITVYLVDTKLKDKDLWIHNLMADFWSRQLCAA
ncbi:tudor domain-containing protein 7A isoform X2 [Syngnathoides biaculeatus]|nr:tudor domain-containing protein 7A isoform X2 [Syngnathoides biaculeatus]